MIRKLEIMCQNGNFDQRQAEYLLQQIDVDQEFTDSKYGIKTTLLNWAATWANVPMVKLLLENGADPNLVYDDGTENTLWNLQYADGDSPEENCKRLEIVRLLLEKGANPHLNLEGDDLYFSALYCHIEHDDGEQWDYREGYICLLEEYGA